MNGDALNVIIFRICGICAEELIGKIGDTEFLIDKTQNIFEFEFFTAYLKQSTIDELD